MTEDGDNSLGFRTYDRPMGEPRLDPLPDDEHFDDCPCCEAWDSICICAQIEADYVEGAGEDQFEAKLDK